MSVVYTRTLQQQNINSSEHYFFIQNNTKITKIQVTKYMLTIPIQNVGGHVLVHAIIDAHGSL